MRTKAEIKKDVPDAVATFWTRMAGESPQLRRLTEEARINAAVAQLIYAAPHEGRSVTGWTWRRNSAPSSPSSPGWRMRTTKATR